MGVDTRRPILPAPTESIVDTTTGESTTGTDLATDVSRRTDKTSYSIPDDGSPVTIPTQRRHCAHGDNSKLSRAEQHSQTSLLIEYFEGGKGSGSLVSRPSVRVRVTPSSSRKLKDQDHHIQITEHGSGRNPTYSRRISLSSPPRAKSQPKEYGIDEYSVSSQSASDDQRLPGRSPVEIELMNRDQASELSTISRDRYFNPTSDISSMPADSMLEAPSSGPRRKRSSSLEREQSSDAKSYLKTPNRKRSRSLSAERVAHRVVEKLSHGPREAAANNNPLGKGQQQRAAYNNNRDIGDFQESDPKSPRRRFAAYRGDDENMSPESSLLSASALSSHRKSGDQYSFKSGTSKSSINNPKLLETVEDAIRRLILPELKELKKDQKVMTNTSKFERDISASYSPASSPSRDELGRRLSKHASAPDVRKPKVVLNKDSQEEGIVLSGDSVPSQRERRPSRDSEMTSDTSQIKWGSRPELTEQEKLRRQRSRGLRDAEKAGRVGNALTAAALKHHDSRSSIDKNERRRPSGPRSRTGSVNETELVFQKHNVAPMPLRSAIESEMTRDSLLSEQTREPTELSDNRYATQEVSRGSPRQMTSPTSRAPNRDPIDSRYDLKHSNMSSHNLSIHSASDHDDREQSYSPVGDAAAGAIAAAAVANLLGVSEHETGFNDRRRTLSPIQSVASYQSEPHVKQDSTRRDGQANSADERGLEQRLSIDSLSSAPSTNLARSTRPEYTNQSDFLRHRHDDDYDDHDLGYESTPVASPRNRKWHEEEEDDYDDDHHQNDDHYDNYEDDGYAYRNSIAETATTNDDPKRMAGYTDNSEVNFMDKVKQGHPVAGIGSNPQYVHPSTVESAVASLLDPTILGGKSDLSGATRSQTETDLSRRVVENHSRSPSPKPVERTGQAPPGSRHGSPLKQRQDASSPDATSFPRRMGATSPPQSVTQSLDDLGPTPRFAHEDYHDHGSPSPMADRSPDSESEINTNPSIIQGPIGGVPHDHWAGYDQTPSRGDQSPLFDNTGAAAGSAGLGLDPMDHQQPGYHQDYYANDYDPSGADYYDQQYPRGELFGTPPGIKDEGYVSAANPLSPSNDTPEPKGFGGMGLFDSPTGDQPRQLSGYSQGVGSPLYDSATGRGIERIQSKDIVALMDHLTVRDAQRNARDTEILVTLVRSAAEMRNSFEEMKKFISQQDDLLMESSDRQHDRTFRALGGPRPLPASGARGARQNSAEDGEDMRSKRKNVFKRALKGLSLKSGNDLGRIEDMLEQLLDEVEILRTGQDDQLMRRSTRAPSVDPEGYEPDGHAGTSSDNHSGYLSTFSRPVQEPRGVSGRREPEHRVSTVPEADEEDEEELDANGRGEFLSPHLASMENSKNRHERAGSAPVSTPPRTVPMASGALSNETTPKTSDKARKHKSSSSSFFPKISRWSKTTASSMGDNIRNSVQPSRKDRVSFEASRSGSDVNGPYRAGDYYDAQGDDRIRSTYTLDDQRQENRPPSPLVPSQLSEAPKYQAHRDSLDLQHPQPRQGPTGRYQSALETQAQAYGIPVDQWGSNPSLSGVHTNNQRHSGASRLSPISDAGYSEASSRTGGPPRPPKVRDDGPLIPERAPKSSVGDEDRSYADRVASRSSAMRSPRSTPPPARKPTGPRPLTSGNPNSPGRRKRSYYRGSPDQIDDEHVY
ncbi:uncharacterized protein KD926_008905 [Aspergillus affinis]|uniref:uncharacterized protein n=1 Tax=Aspergillus affinis TaxID=1070780 RepID=UPI0022FE72F5|nr:uncharacterized protein KD926_008905 [Aspergillus affinis]KAI9039920.1 hypothetical protein KD926_008905 [Aspergillus affinis]